MVPRAAQQLYTAIAIDGDLPAARAIWKKLGPLMRIQFSSYLSKGEGAHWFSVMKAVLNMIGPPVGDPQPPILPLQENYRKEISKMLAELDYRVKS
jgi:4-hydroxy-tetrahydrodipicolinate synthase